MSHRVGQALSAAFVLGFLGWVMASTRPTGQAVAPGPDSHETPGAAAASAPCRQPVAWYVADVDPRFGVTRSWVASAARDAAAVWGAWDGRPLLVEREGEGVPIRMAYDDRQGRLDERIRREGVLRQLDDSLRERSGKLSADLSRYRAARLRAGHGSSIGDSLDVVGEALDVRAAALDSARSARDEAWNVLARDFPEDRLEAAVFRVSEGATAGTRYREIRVYTFRDRDELVWTLAHEFGHALGVEHTEDGTGLMGGEQVRVVSAEEEPELSPADVRVLGRRCGEGAPPVGPR